MTGEDGDHLFLGRGMLRRKKKEKRKKKKKINCLKINLQKYARSSYNTFLQRQIFGIHFIDDTMTLSATRMVNPDRYSFIQVRSAKIPTTFDERWDWIKVFELLLKLKADLIEQERITSLLEKQRVGLLEVDVSVQDAFK
ncbi:uncharacterized protein BX664DRAFT_323831, partial [Halteromyces radiatus]|uniref:uncharacterized protein n=1 Tax=Halteromyces radiatus TaxID=101107 RepID=UPI0022206298